MGEVPSSVTHSGKQFWACSDHSRIHCQVYCSAIVVATGRVLEAVSLWGHLQGQLRSPVTVGAA